MSPWILGFMDLHRHLRYVWMNHKEENSSSDINSNTASKRNSIGVGSSELVRQNRSLGRAHSQAGSYCHISRTQPLYTCQSPHVRVMQASCLGAGV